MELQRVTEGYKVHGYSGLIRVTQGYIWLHKKLRIVTLSKGGSKNFGDCMVSNSTN